MSEEIILITGGSGAIAAETARQIANSGRVIIVNYRSNESAARTVVADIEDRGGVALSIRADISSEDEVEKMFDQVRERFGKLDVLIHNASPDLTRKSIQKIKWEDFQHHIEVQVKGGLLCSQGAISLMKDQSRGQIVSILSAFVLGSPGSGFSSYVTAKHALLGLMQCIGTESIRWGVRVNLVSPSLNQTDLVSCMPERVFEMAAENHPMGRLCTPADVAGTIKFLLSKEASYLHLANIPVNGGTVG